MNNEMEKRLLLAIVLSTLVLGLFTLYYERQHPPAPQPQPPSVAVAPPSPSAPAVSGSAAPPPNPVVVSPASKRTVKVDSPLYHATLSNVGAIPTSWRLKKYKEDIQGSQKGTGPDANEDFEMIPQYLPSDAYHPYSLTTGDAGLDREINSQVYEIKSEAALTNDTHLNAPVTLTLWFQRPGLYVEKIYSFKEDNYILEVKPRIVMDGKDRACSLILGPSVGGQLPNAADTRTIPQMVAEYEGKKIDRKPGEKLDKEYVYSDVHNFAGVEVQYFASVFLPATPHEARFQKFYYKDPAQPDKEAVPNLVLAMLPTNNTPTSTFIGPKEYDTLHKINPDLTRLIDYGRLAPIVKGLLIVLKTIYQYIHNYGVAIIILTFLLTVVLFPLRYKQIVSMKKMQRLQPRIRAIQEKYRRIKNADVQQRQEMQKEIMAVYSQHGVNPLGGCLPMLPQLPIFFAFNSLLAYSIELRKAPFIWWIKDLSAKDPYYVTPILMGLTMLIQQKMTPSTSGDPTQDKMMLIMPIMMTFFFANLSSGLTLYFLFSNIFGIILQKVVEHWIPSESDGGTQRTATMRR